ncbi:MAG: hypothetical protein HC919_02355 [Oscillatoriales cyanobacterium SM2_2_1]|nr:hypothetical protein [Oscillatoriales cyanobacterium SM2_2_1]
MTMWSGAIAGCMPTLPPKPFSHEVSPTEPLARITEIQQVPVWVRFLNSGRDRPVREVGIALRAGETVRTEGASLAQITLKDGLVLRLGKDGVVVLQSNGTVQVTRGQVLAWMAPEPGTMGTLDASFGQLTAENATIYLELPRGERDNRLVRVLQGTVVVKLVRSPEPITVKAGELLTVLPDGTADSPKPVEPAAIAKQFDNHPLLFAFRTQIASLPQITSQFGLRTVVTTRTIEYQSRSRSPESPPAQPTAARREPEQQPRSLPAAQPAATPTSKPTAKPDTENTPAPTPQPVASPADIPEPVPPPESSPNLPVQPEPQPEIELVPPPERPSSSGSSPN